MEEFNVRAAQMESYKGMLKRKKKKKKSTKKG